MSTNSVIALPADIASRSAIRRVLAQRTIAGTDVVIDATAVTRHGSAGIDELVKQLLGHTPLQRVIVVNANASFQHALTVIHRVRTRPEKTFLLLFKQVPAEALLRSA